MRKYSGNGRDTKSSGEGIKRLVVLSVKRWGCKPLGIYSNRDKRGKPGNLSVHALWRAADISFDDDADRKQACDWFVKYADNLKIDFIVDYAYRGPLRRAYGRAWRCDRGKWENLKKGDVVGGGEAWARFLHIELGYGYTTTEKGDVFERTWRALPRP